MIFRGGSGNTTKKLKGGLNIQKKEVHGILYVSLMGLKQ